MSRAFVRSAGPLVNDAFLDNRAASVEAAHAYAHPRVAAMQPGSQPQLYDGYGGDPLLQIHRSAWLSFL